MRQQVDRKKIEEFLQQLGRRFTKSGRVYLVGGTTMVYEGLRQQTLDIDLAIDVEDVDHSEFISVVRDLKNRLSLNIEEASLWDFIPLPSGYLDRSLFINRYGQLDVFHFDLYSIALSKIERNSEEDISDIVALLQTERININLLISYFDEIIPLYSTESLRQDPEKFQQKFDTFIQYWNSISKS